MQRCGLRKTDNQVAPLYIMKSIASKMGQPLGLPHSKFYKLKQ